MSRRIAFTVVEFPAVRRNQIQGKAYVMGDIRIGVFVYCDCGGGVRHEYNTDAFLHA